MEARPEIPNHNVETAPRLFKTVQPQDNYEWTAATLSNAKKLDPNVLTKLGIMLGLGKTMDEVKATIRDQRSWGVDILTIGQYLQPSKKHMPMGGVESAGEVVISRGGASEDVECGALENPFRRHPKNRRNCNRLYIHQKSVSRIYDNFHATVSNYTSDDWSCPTIQANPSPAFSLFFRT